MILNLGICISYCAPKGDDMNEWQISGPDTGHVNVRNVSAISL